MIDLDFRLIKEKKRTTLNLSIVPYFQDIFFIQVLKFLLIVFL